MLKIHRLSTFSFVIVCGFLFGLLGCKGDTEIAAGKGSGDIPRNVRVK